VEINPAGQSAAPNQVILCRIKYQSDVPTSTKGILHVTPRITLSFPVGIDVPVLLKPGESHVWLPNKCYEFVSVVPGEKAAMTEDVIRLQEQAKPPAEIELMVTICNGNHRFSEPVGVPSEAPWDQVLTSWQIQAIAKESSMGRYPGIAGAYILKTEKGDVITSMDGVSRVFAHFLPTMISQPASDGTVKIKLIYKVLNGVRKRTTFSCDFRVLPTETEADLLTHWKEALRDGRIRVRSMWEAFMRNRPRDPTKYEWFT
jgi:hypothetical protein